jgi:hypothetical protein
MIAKSLWRTRSTKKLRFNTTTGLEVTTRSHQEEVAGKPVRTVETKTIPRSEDQ